MNHGVLLHKKTTNYLVICVFIVLCFFAGGCSKDDAPQAEDTKEPRVGTQITFSDIKYNQITLSWGDASDEVTPKERLQYRILTSSTYININTVSECARITGDAVVRDWSEYVQSFTVKDLTPQTVYWFAVLVRDEKGNMALYYPQQVRTLTDDAPRPGQAISFSNRMTDSVKVEWGFATDDNFSTNELEYRLVKSDSATKIDTVNEALAVSGEDLVMDWTENINNTDVTGLSMGTRYYFAVLVRNPKLKAALYAPKMTTTIDTEKPTPGGSISFSGIDSDRVTVNWPAATDNLTLEGDLYYKVVRANTSEDIDTETEANTAPNVVMGWTRNMLSAQATDLLEYTDYYFAVLVKDEQENMNLYTPQSVRTKDIHAPIPGNEFNMDQITQNSIRVSFEKASDWQPGNQPDDLQYRLVWAYDAGDIDEDFEINASSNVIVGYDWVNGGSLSWNGETHTKTVSGLSEATTYYFAIAVRDLDGNMAVYSPNGAKTKDVTPPGVGSITIAPQDVHSTWLKMSFSEAADNSYSNDQLQYRIAIATSSAEIDSVSEVNALSSSFPPAPGLVRDWGSYAALSEGNIQIENLTNNVTYYIAVLVKDPEDNMALYPLENATTHKSWEPLGMEGFAETSSDDVFTLRIIGGEVYVAYLDGAEARRQYVTVQKYNNGWSAVGVAGCSSEVALHVDLEADGSGNQYIGYVAYNNNSPVAKVMNYDASSWSYITGIPAPIGKVKYLDLAMKDSNPGLVYVDNYIESEISNFAPKVFEYDGSMWNELSGLENISSGENAYVSISIKYSNDSTPLPFVSFNDVTNSDELTVKKNESSGWSVVGSAGFSDEKIKFSQLAFDSANTPYVAYLGETSNGMVVRVKKFNNTEWENVGTSPIDTGGNAMGLSLAIYGTTPYVAFSDSTKNYKARVMKLETGASSWEYVEYVSTGISPSSISNVDIAVDSSGMPYIAFRQNNMLTVMVYK